MHGVLASQPIAMSFSVLPSTPVRRLPPDFSHSVQATVPKMFWPGHFAVGWSRSGRQFGVPNAGRGFDCVKETSISLCSLFGITKRGDAGIRTNPPQVRICL